MGTKEQKDSSSNQITEEELKEGGDATVKILSTEDTPSHFLKQLQARKLQSNNFFINTKKGF